MATLLSQSQVLTISSNSIKEPVPWGGRVIQAALTAAGEGIALQQAGLPLVQRLQQVGVGNGHSFTRLYGSHGAHQDGAVGLEEVCSVGAAAVVEPAGQPAHVDMRGIELEACPGECLSKRGRGRGWGRGAGFTVDANMQAVELGLSS